MELVPFVAYIAKQFASVLGLSSRQLQASPLFASLSDIGEHIRRYYKRMCEHLDNLFDKYKRLERKCRMHYEQKGDLPEALISALPQALQAFEQGRQSLTALAPLLDCALTEFKEADPQFNISEGKIVFTSNIKGNAIAAHQDEAERDFYENLPHLPNLDHLALEKLDQEPAVDNEVDDLEKEPVVPEINPDRLDAKSLQASLSSDAATLLKRFEAVHTKDDIDRLSQEYAANPTLISAKQLCQVRILIPSHSTQLIRQFLFNVAKYRLELIPYIARFFATVKVLDRELVEELNDSVPLSLSKHVSSLCLSVDWPV